jgi:hypothetical protein
MVIYIKPGNGHATLYGCQLNRFIFTATTGPCWPATALLAYDRRYEGYGHHQILYLARHGRCSRRRVLTTDHGRRAPLVGSLAALLATTSPVTPACWPATHSAWTVAGRRALLRLPALLAHRARQPPPALLLASPRVRPRCGT